MRQRSRSWSPAPSTDLNSFASAPPHQNHPPSSPHAKHTDVTDLSWDHSGSCCNILRPSTMSTSSGQAPYLQAKHEYIFRPSNIFRPSTMSTKSQPKHHEYSDQVFTEQASCTVIAIDFPSTYVGSKYMSLIPSINAGWVASDSLILLDHFQGSVLVSWTVPKERKGGKAFASRGNMAVSMEEHLSGRDKFQVCLSHLPKSMFVSLQH